MLQRVWYARANACNETTLFVCIRRYKCRCYSLRRRRRRRADN